jgi:hypothetical protein
VPALARRRQRPQLIKTAPCGTAGRARARLIAEAVIDNKACDLNARQILPTTQRCVRD